MNLTFAAKGTVCLTIWVRQLRRAGLFPMVYLAYMDRFLEKAFHRTSKSDSQNEIVVAAFLANLLLAYLSWLRGSEIFEGEQEDLDLTLLPQDGLSCKGSLRE